MFEPIIKEMAEKFGIGDKAKDLLGMVLAFVFNEKNGGAEGFVARLRNLGLGDIVSSWISRGDNLPINNSQIEQVFGSQFISHLANKVGLPRDTALSATASFLPKVVDALTPDAVLPNASVLGSIKGYFGQFEHALGDFLGDAKSAVGAAGAAAAGMATNAAGAVSHAARDVAADVQRSGIPSWLKWLIPLALLLTLGYCMMNRKGEEFAAIDTTATPATTTTPVVAEPAPAPVQANARFNFDNVDGLVTVGGQLANEADKLKLMDALKATFGADKVQGDISIDPNTLSAAWLDKLIGLLPEFKASGLKFGFDGDSINLDTSALTEDARIALSNKLRGAFGGFSFSGLWDKASAAFAALSPGQSSADDLVKALNLMAINFDTGSATISRDSMEIIGKAAEFLKALPAGTKFEVGGHTDNVGKADSNLALSNDRANAVMAKLVELGVAADMLSAKGYGDAKPVADNGTDEGRAANRRIEFNVTK